MPRLPRLLATVLAGSLLTAPCQGSDALPHRSDGAGHVADLLASHRVVALGENHGHRELHEWLLGVLADPRVARALDVIVVEFATRQHQGLLDRLVAGEPVPADSIAWIWRDTILSPSPIWDQPVYARFFDGVRRLNLDREDGRRYRVRAGDAAVDWSSVEERADLVFPDRSASMGDVVREEVRAGHRVLLIAGSAHLTRVPMIRTNRNDVPWAEVTVVMRIELHHPGSTAVIRSMGRFEAVDHARLTGVPRGALVPLAGTWLGRIPANGITRMRNMDGSPFRLYGDATLADLADLVLYWGPPDANHFPDLAPGTFADEPAWAELDRRSRVVRGQPLDPALRR